MSRDDYYTHPQEVWDEKECHKRSRRNYKNGYGDKNPWPGLLSDHGSSYAGYGQSVRYNGGCIRDDKHYKGEENPFPKIAEGYVVITRPTWGYYLVREDDEDVTEDNVVHRHEPEPQTV